MDNKNFAAITLGMISPEWKGFMKSERLQQVARSYCAEQLGIKDDSLLFWKVDEKTKFKFLYVNHADVPKVLFLDGDGGNDCKQLSLLDAKMMMFAGLFNGLSCYPDDENDTIIANELEVWTSMFNAALPGLLSNKNNMIAEAVKGAEKAANLGLEIYKDKKIKTIG